MWCFRNIIAFNTPTGSVFIFFWGSLTLAGGGYCLCGNEKILLLDFQNNLTGE